MALMRELEISGNKLFKHRSLVPLVMLVPFLIKMNSYHFPLKSHALHELMHLACAGVTFAGLGIRIFVAGHAPDGTSGRNTKEQRAARLNTTGLYSVQRHPLYLGNFLMWAGIPMFCADMWLMLVYALAFWLYYERIMYAEECFLRTRFGLQFTEWAARTPAFLPDFRQWVRPDLRFSWRRALRQEYTSLFLAVQALTAVELLEHWQVDHRLVFETEWIIFSVIGLTLYVVVRFIKKRTDWLVDHLALPPAGLES